MLKMNKKLEYALIVLKHFQKLQDSDNELITARNIAEIYKTPFDTTAKVMQLMNSHHILESSQGVKGGYRLKRSLEDISYYDLAEIIEGKAMDHDCFEMNCGLVQTCNIVSPIKSLNHKLKEFFKTLTIEQLLLGSNDEYAPVGSKWINT